MSAPISIQAAVRRYLEERRHLGFEIRISGGQLLRFGRFADARRHRGPLTLALQFAWARQHVRHTSSMTAARRLEVLRPFVKYYRQFEPESVVPDQTALGRAHRQLTPHIYTEKEVIDLLHAAGGLDPQGGLRPATYKTLFGLIASTGLRLSEALNLRARDIDLDDGALTIRQTKFAKSRRLPIHPSVVQELRAYHAMWGRGDIRDHDTPFFVSITGRALPKRTVHSVFERLRTQLGWEARGGHPNPRIHDLRHTFAVRRVKQWHEGGSSIDQGMFLLCTYLGHAKISDTYWYLSGVPDLMDVVGTRFDRFVMGEEVGHA